MDDTNHLTAHALIPSIVIDTRPTCRLLLSHIVRTAYYPRYSVDVER